MADLATPNATGTPNAAPPQPQQIVPLCSDQQLHPTHMCRIRTRKECENRCINKNICSRGLPTETLFRFPSEYCATWTDYSKYLAAYSLPEVPKFYQNWDPYQEHAKRLRNAKIEATLDGLRYGRPRGEIERVGFYGPVENLEVLTQYLGEYLKPPAWNYDNQTDPFMLAGRPWPVVRSTFDTIISTNDMQRSRANRVPLPDMQEWLS